MPAITGIAHVELSVRDLDRSRAWYEKVFGARPVFDNRNDADAVTERALLEPATGIIFAFTKHDANQGEPFDPRRTGMDHLSFAVADRAELERWHAHLAALGESPGDIVEWNWGGVSFSVPDPDGIAIEFFFRGVRS